MSYARGDRSRADQLVRCLKREGWDVWWDDSLVAGEDFAKVIELELNAAPVVLVLWSEISVQSGFILDEANVGKERGALVPVAIDDTRPPLGFRYLHTHSLANWGGGAEDGSYVRLARVIGHKLSPGGDEAAPERPGPPEPDQDDPVSDDPVSDDPVSDDPVSDDPVSDDPVSGGPAPIEPVSGSRRPDDPSLSEVEPQQPGAASPTPSPAVLRHLRDNVEEAMATSVTSTSVTSTSVELLAALTQLADYLGRSGLHLEALQEYERAMEVAAAAGDSQWRMRINRGQARSLAGLGRHEESIERLAESSESPDDHYALVMVVLDLIDNLAGDPAASAEDLHRLGRRHLDRVDSALRRARFLMDDGWTADQANAVRRGYAQALLGLATVAGDVGDHRGAMDLFERHLGCAREEDREWVAALERLGYEYVAMGDQAQAPGSTEAYGAALAYYELAREIFDWRGSVIGLRAVLSRCATMALALDDLTAFERLKREHHEVGEQFLSGKQSLSSADATTPVWPVSRLQVVSVVVSKVRESAGERVSATVHLQNLGSLSWRGGRALSIDLGIRRRGGRTQWSVALCPEHPVAPHQTIGIEVEVSRTPDKDYEGAEVFVKQPAMPGEEPIAVVSAPI